MPTTSTTEQPAALARLTIVNLDQLVARDRPGKDLTAQYNPRELALDHAVTWTPDPTSKGDHPAMTFTGGAPRTLALELFFDTFESGEDVHKTHVGPLQELLLVMSQTRGEELQRPPRVALVWGEDLPRFVGVVASVNVKYTLFTPGGRPVRATCAVKFIEAARSSEKRGTR
jgi:hypothetical protein